MILSITGPSGVGKTTLMHNLMRAIPEARPLISYTTRSPRPTDEKGEYKYVSFEEFERLSQSGSFLWEARTTTNRYGTFKADIDHALRDGFYIPILVIDAAKKLYDYARAQNKASAVTFMYIRLESEAELRARFKARGDAPAEVEQRIAECRYWNDTAPRSGVPFIYLDATIAPEEIAANALKALGRGH